MKIHDHHRSDRSNMRNKEVDSLLAARYLNLLLIAGTTLQSWFEMLTLRLLQAVLWLIEIFEMLDLKLNKVVVHLKFLNVVKIRGSFHCRDSLNAAAAALTTSSARIANKRQSNFCILNMASPLRPGGGVLNDATSQEEFL